MPSPTGRDVTLPALVVERQWAVFYENVDLPTPSRMLISLGDLLDIFNAEPLLLPVEGGEAEKR